MSIAIVRDAVLGDAEGWARARHASWQVAYRDLLPAEELAAIDLAASIDGTTAWFSTPAPEGTYRLVSLDDAGTVQAMAGCGPAEEPFDDVTGQLHVIYAHPRAWGEGHGRALVEEVHRRLAADGHARALLWVAVGNHDTIAWYERQGWALDGARATEHIAGIDVRVARMVRDLEDVVG